VERSEVMVKDVNVKMLIDFKTLKKQIELLEMILQSCKTEEQSDLPGVLHTLEAIMYEGVRQGVVLKEEEYEEV
jgi:hypothetical protein